MNFVILSISMWWKYVCYVNFVILSVSMWWKYTCDVNFVISSVSMWQTDTHVWCKLCGSIYFNVTERHVCDVDFVDSSISMWKKTGMWCKLCGFIHFNVTKRYCDVNFVVFSILMWLKYHIENCVIDSIVWHSCNMCHTILFWCFSMFITHCRLIHNWISIPSMPIAPPNSFCCSYICPNF